MRGKENKVKILLALLFLGLIGFSNADVPEPKARRLDMVRTQIAARGVTHPATLKAMQNVKRHLFVPANLAAAAYLDRPLPIGYGQTISQPFIVAFMTEAVRPQPDHRILEIGCGSGYQAAVLAEIVNEVYTVEIIAPLADTAAQRLSELGYENIRVRQADGYHGWPKAAPFDAIVVTAATEFIPPPLIEQLKDGGRMIIPVGSPLRTQQLMLIEKKKQKIISRNLMPVRFVPFTRSGS
ncbi:MAG TPA: protein-L-isoaspartate(D-aspartate) O-methyltransferase [Candidatus Aminicenantes bacterium]|nr:protein-L-isoaspartate(D-aspartate) O-methyltransferase [Candidatus Aminicenantes bacterium]